MSRKNNQPKKSTQILFSVPGNNSLQGKQQVQKQQQQRPRRKQQQQRNQSSELLSSSFAAKAYSTGISGNKPNVMTRNNGKTCVVQHKELLANITGTTLFSLLLQVRLNPGLYASFPWLANIAQNWEFYRFKKLQFRYHTRCGTDARGSLMMVPDYDPADNPPSTEQIASSYEDVQEDVPWKDQICVCKPSALHGVGVKKLVRSQPLGPNQDINQYDSGNMFIFGVDGFVGLETTLQWGKIWVEYEVEFDTPQLNPSPSLLGLAGGVTVGVSGITLARPFGTNPTQDDLSFVNWDLDVGTTTSDLRFMNAGEYLVTSTIEGTVLSVTSITVPSGGISLISNSSTPNAAATRVISVVRFTVTVAGSELRFVQAGTTITTSQAYIAQVPV